MAKITKEEHVEAVRTLKKWLKPGSTVYCVIRGVAKSGMSRKIDFYTITGKRMQYLSGYISKLLGYRRDKDQGLHVSGCGMDMGFAVVYELSHTLWPKGFKVTDKTPHRNGTPNGQIDEDGGYALRHEWL